MVMTHRSLRMALLGAWFVWGASLVFGQGAPQLTAISTNRAQPGSLITLTGLNFLNPPLTGVTFNFAPGTVESIRSLGLGYHQISVRVPVGATIGPILVENALGQTQTPWNFQVPPVVQQWGRVGAQTEVDKVRGAPGDLVLLTGANFKDPDDPGFRLGVFFDGIRAALDTVTEGSALAVVPPGAMTGPITVTNNAGVTATVGLFHTAPWVSGFTPRARVGDTLTLTGRSFRSVSLVSFGGVATTNLTVVSNTLLRVVVPPGAPAAAPLTLESPGGRFLSVSNFVLAPRLGGFTPSGGGVGTLVTVTGSGLSGVTQVAFGGVTAKPVSVAAGQLTVRVPAGAGTGPLVVSGTSGTDESSSVFHAPPQVLSVVPNLAKPGETVTLNGTNLLGATAVLFGADRVAGTGLVGGDNRRLTVRVPEGATTGLVWVVTPGGEASGGPISIQGPLPVISGFSPAFGTVGTEVRISGTELGPPAVVRFAGVVAPGVSAWTNGLRVLVPAGAVSGRITVETAAGSAVSPLDFLVGTTADVDVTLTPSAEPVVAGAEFRLNLRARNLGPLPATNVTGTLSLPTPAEFLGVTLGGGGSFQSGAAGVSFVVGTLPAKSEWTALVRVRIPVEASPRFEWVAATTTPDPDAADNRAAVTVRAQPLRLDLTGFGDDQWVLSWSALAAGFELQESTLELPRTWRPVDGVPLNDGVRFQWSTRATNAGRLFRLRSR
jgi:hypothetical protein